MLSTLVALGIALQAFGAVYAPESLGFLAASPGVMVLAVAAVVTGAGKAASDIPGQVWKLLAWGAVNSILAWLVLGSNALYLSKVAPLAILSLVWLTPLLAIDRLRTSDLRFALVTALAISAFGYVFVDLLPTALPAAFKALVFGGAHSDYVDPRPRGFMSEPSHLATLVGRYSLVLLLISETGRRFVAWRLVVKMVCIAAVLMGFKRYSRVARDCADSRAWI